MKDKNESFLLKADFIPLTVINMVDTNIENFQAKWSQTIAKAPHYFTHAPVVIDVKKIAKNDALDVSALCTTLKASKIIPVGIKGLAKHQHDEAIANGLAILKSEPQSPTKKQATPPKTKTLTQVITKPVRAGSQVYAKDTDLIILSSVNAGAEVIADGNIHIYGPLRGRALAGAMGNDKAHIFCASCEAELISIAGHYLVKENLCLPSINKPMIHISLNGDELNIEGI